jgi:hypothetical protein
MTQDEQLPLAANHAHHILDPTGLGVEPSVLGIFHG